MRVDFVGRAPHHVAAGNALAAGLGRHGIATTLARSESEAVSSVVACWGWKTGRRLKAIGKRVLVMELGYVGDRKKWVSLAWDGLNGRGTVPQVDDGGARWQERFSGYLQPWKASGIFALIMGQVNGDASIEGVSIGTWYRAACAAAKRFGLPVMFRPHPLSDEWPVGATILKGSLAAALEQAAVVITFNSNSGVDAVLAGVPTIACDEGSMAWPVAAHGLDAELMTPVRCAWCAALAWRQWRIEEIERGDAWEYMRKAL